MITDTTVQDDAQLLAQVDAAIRGGATIVQYRDKTADQERRARIGRRLVQLCHSRRVLLLVNDDVQLARAVGADGVHLGQGDSTIESARQSLGKEAIIGISCHDSVELASVAAQAGADYVAFGRFFPSITKPGAPPARTGTLRDARRRLNIPLVAIGGITPENGAQLLDAGADALAVIDAVFGQTDIEQAARRFSRLFDVNAAGDAP